MFGDPEDEGDGGNVGGRFAEAALERRGNAQARKQLEDQSRIYCMVEQKHWEHKYKFFSARHMERSYRLFTRARHDPFNKDPSWGKSIIHRLANACAAKSIKPESLFSGVDITGDGKLNRAEMKRIVCNVLPQLSDEELTAIFDVIDEDHSGEINVHEFCDVLRRGKDFKVAEDTAHRWRNPIHRMKRFAPAQVEGWDHLEGDVKFKQCDKLCASMQSEMQSRLGETLVQSARGQKSVVAARPKYNCFNGGGDGDRFRWQQFAKDRAIDPARLTPRITDPGPFPRPGWMYETEMRESFDKHGIKFDLPRAPLTAR
jgi:hypothetical protein